MRFSAAPVRRMLLAMVLAGWLHAQDMRPVVGPGATRDEVINAYGWPTGQSQAGLKEILRYPQGSVTLENGRVVQVDFSTKIPWGAPRAKPPPPTASTAKKNDVAAPVDDWDTNYAQAVGEATKRQVRILALFVGSDWSPPSKRFLDEVAESPEFVTQFIADFVFLKLDFPTRAKQAPELKKQNEELRAKCAVTTYPALVVLSDKGEPLAVVDLAKERPGATYRDQMIAAVGEVRDLLRVKPIEVEAPPPPPEKTTGPGEGTKVLDAAMNMIANALGYFLGVGLALAIGFVWWVRRTRGQSTRPQREPPKLLKPKAVILELPTLPELVGWPTDRVRLLVSATFEAAGYKTRFPPGREADIELLRPGHTKPTVLVRCRPGIVGAVGPKIVRELFAMVIAESIETGWVVSAGGFSKEAQVEAKERGVELISGEDLLERLHNLSAAALSAVLNRAAG
jgi:restriction endonuclease/thioredoxin family protein